MESQWSLLKEVKEGNNNYIEALADVPADSPWFCGHFPGNPILPGIAIIQLVRQVVVREALKKGEYLQLQTLKRVRFVQPVWPGDTLHASITVENAEEEVIVSFKVAKKDNIVCSGLIAAKRIINKK